MKIAKQEVTLLDSMGSDRTVVNAARVSFHKQHDVFDEVKDTKLINYLAKHNHWTVFGHCTASFRIKAPIFVARQMGKHQVGLVWNEVSRRYVDDEPEFFFPGRGNWRHRATNVKQGSAGIGAKLKKPFEQHEDLWADLDNQHDPDLHVSYAVQHCLDVYTQMLEGGVAPEQARMVLPQNMMTSWVWTGSLAAYSRICKLRLDPHAQEETRELAQEISNHMETLFPVSWKALNAV